MKNQLLEDFGDSRSSPASAREAAPRQSGHAAEQGPRAKVWRGRPPDAAPPAEPPAEQETQPNWNEPFMTADFSAFASQQPDLSIQYPDEPAPWFERWGRKALGWTAGLALAVGVIGGGLWMYHESQVESTLALVADQSPPAAPAPAPVAQAPAPAPLPAAQRAEIQAVALDEGETLEPGDAAAAAAIAAPVVAAAVPEPPPKPKPKPRVRKRVPERTVLARSEARPVATPAPAPAREYTLAETLRQCRAAGYHASQCMKRGCVATKYGLACRG